jgi:hypothetical protein
LRRRLLVVIALLFAIALFACRDILGINGDTTITDASDDVIDAADSGVSDVVTDAFKLETDCGTVTIVAPTNGGQPVALAADDAGAFWGEQIGPKLGGIYGWVDGGPVAVATNTEKPIDVRIDALRVYWNAWNDGSQGPTLSAWDRSTKLPVASALLDTLGAGRIATDDNYIYFGTWQQHDGGLYKIDSTLSSASLPQPLALGRDAPFHVALANHHLYFDEGSDDTTGEGKSVSVLDLLDGGVSQVTDSGPIAVDDLAAFGDAAYWSQANVSVVDRSDQASYQTFDHPTSLSVEPSGTYFFLAAHTQLIRVPTNVNDTNRPVCFDAGQTGQVAVVAAIANRTYFAANVSGIWKIFQLAY